MKKLIVLAVIAVVLAFGGWYVASPGLALTGLRDAAIEGDRDALDERVDFPAVRAAFKEQASAQIAAELGRQAGDNAFAALGAAFATSLAEPIIDAAISPDGVKALVDYGKARGPDGTLVSASEKPVPVEWEIDRQGLDYFVARAKQDSADTASLVFERRGLGWVLVDVRFPVGGGREG